METRLSRCWTLLAVLAAVMSVSLIGCRVPGPTADPAGGGGRSGLTPSPVISWQSHSALQVGPVQLDFDLEARMRARVLPPEAGKILTGLPRLTEP
ncbi:hypothetical protein ES703_50887 [subsurface metagenome]